MKTFKVQKNWKKTVLQRISYCQHYLIHQIIVTWHDLFLWDTQTLSLNWLTSTRGILLLPLSFCMYLCVLCTSMWETEIVHARSTSSQMHLWKRPSSVDKTSKHLIAPILWHSDLGQWQLTVPKLCTTRTAFLWFLIFSKFTHTFSLPFHTLVI